jgi:thiol-disulfide isomerase/thioredoxin
LVDCQATKRVIERYFYLLAESPLLCRQKSGIPAMIKQLFAILLFATPLLTQAQEVPLITRDQIEAWKNTPSDTILVVNFWATWCAPCVKELPNFDAIQEKYAGKKVKVVLVSTDFKRDIDSGLKPFILRKGIKSEVVFMNESNPNNYVDLVNPDWSGALPATMVICTNKKIERFHEGELSLDELDSLVTEAF